LIRKIGNLTTFAITVARKATSRTNAGLLLRKSKRSIGRIMKRSEMQEMLRSRIKGHPLKMLIYSMKIKMFAIRCVY